MCIRDRLRHDSKKEKNSNTFLRLFIEGGSGCSGYSYKFQYDENLEDEDLVYEKDGQKIFAVDSTSLQLIKGAVIDYEDMMIRSAFVVNENPNADKSCSCKVSFLSLIHI
eukprot:TRINITY_DN6190_c0_g1_i1.p1 TRINITY_DN6190_c0_g1~~TRINITY_DN6190_c0_g1_i1.p1  ORF type:complete len:110 (+),score=18.53 TRINITY_DN6190_c0_g1_i1:62-391(+)